MPPFKPALGVALLASALAAHALEFKPADGVQARVDTTLTLGTIVRTADPDPSDYALIPSTVVPGARPGRLMGQTGGSDLNFDKGDAVSTLAKAMIDVDVRSEHFGVFVRGDAWGELAQGRDKVAYGNYPNGFTPNAPLSDRGFAQDAKFSAVRLRDAYAAARFEPVSKVQGEVKVGRQVLGWGTSQFFAGGVGAATNPNDLAAQFRPGALPQEARVPIGMVDIAVGSGQDWGVEGYVPYEFRPTNVPGCGTFFDAASIVQPGCNMSGAVGAPIAGTPLSTLASLTERAILASGYYVHRDADVQARDGGQFGLSMRYRFPAVRTEFRLYAATTHNTTPNVYRVKIEDVNGATLPAGLAGGFGRLANPNGIRYSVLFPEGTRLFGLSLDSRPAPFLRVFGELAYRPNQPIGMSPIDLLTASLLRAPTSLLAEQRGFLAVPAGGHFDAYDRFRVTTANLGANAFLPKTLGADRIDLAAELGTSHVSGLPDPTVMRYGRGLAYGAAPYLSNGTLTPCSESAPGLNGVTGKSCTGDGFVSSDAWGLRGRVAANFSDVVMGAALVPAIVFAKDLRGYSYDGTFSQGRITTRTSLRADWNKRWFCEVAYTHFAGGKYNLLADRSNASLVAGLAF